MEKEQVVKQLEELRDGVVDSLHWEEYNFIGQGNMIFEGILTQESEIRIVDQILSYLASQGVMIKTPHGMRLLSDLLKKAVGGINATTEEK